MSLINDALKRAKQAQQQAPPPPNPGPEFRPVEPSQYARHGVGVLLPTALALVALLGLLFLWQLSRNGDSVRALQAGPAPTTPAPERRALAPREADNTTAQSQSPALRDRLPAVTPPASPVPEPVAGAPANASAPAPSVAATASTNSAVAPEPPAPKPPPLRLQAIVFDPKRPSALINGKTLFLGDHIGAFRLVALDQESATLVSLAETNVLALP